MNLLAGSQVSDRCPLGYLFFYYLNAVRIQTCFQKTLVSWFNLIKWAALFGWIFVSVSSGKFKLISARPGTSNSSRTDAA